MENYLIHYGVKGMKWGKHVKALDAKMVQDSRDAGRAQIRLASAKANYNNAFSNFEKENKRYNNHPNDNTYRNLKKAEDDVRKTEEIKNKLGGEVGYMVDKAQNSKFIRDTQIRIHNNPYEKKAKNYEADRNNSERRESLGAAQVKASMDVGRAQSKIAAANAVGPGKTIASNAAFYNQKAADATAEKKAKETLKAVSSLIQEYDAKTQKKVDKILSKTTPLSKIFGKKGK